MNNTDLKSAAIENETLRQIEAYEGIDIFSEMFRLADFEHLAEHEEQHLDTRMYTFAREEDGSQFSTSIKKYSEPSEEELQSIPQRCVENEEVWECAYYEIIFKNDDDGEYKDREYYYFETHLEPPEEEITYSAYAVGTWEYAINGDRGGIHGFESLEEIKDELKDWAVGAMGQIGSEDPMDFAENYFQIYTMSSAGTKEDIETVDFDEFYDFENEKAVA